MREERMSLLQQAIVTRKNCLFDSSLALANERSSRTWQMVEGCMLKTKLTEMRSCTDTVPEQSLSSMQKIVREC